MCIVIYVAKSLLLKLHRLTIASLQSNPSSDSIDDTNAHNMATIVFHKAFKLLDLLLDAALNVAFSLRLYVQLRAGEDQSLKKRKRNEYCVKCL